MGILTYIFWDVIFLICKKSDGSYNDNLETKIIICCWLFDALVCCLILILKGWELI